MSPINRNYRVLPLRAREGLEVVAVKGYFAFPKAPALQEPHYQIFYYHIQDSRSGGLIPLKRCTRRILQP